MSKASIEEIKRVYLEASTAQVGDVIRAMGHMGIVCDPAIRPIKLGLRFCGQAYTLQYVPHRKGDQDVGRKFRSSAMPHGVPVLATSGIIDQVLWGENMMNMSRHGGAVAHVVDGYLRDLSAYLQMDFPVFCRGVTSGPVRGVEIPTTAIAMNVPVVCGGVRCDPGDIVLGDDDGVIIVPRQAAEKSVPHVKWFANFEKDKWGPACSTADLDEVTKLTKQKKEYLDKIFNL